MKALFKQETQSAIGFPVQLTERYRPQTIDAFVGLPKAKAIFNALLKSPRACSLLLTGSYGCGKTSMSLAFAKQLNAGLIHVPARELTVDTVAGISEKIQYYPPSGGFWVIVADEADKMSNAAQVALLSLLDCAATLKPTFGGGFTQGKAIPAIWIFTCNGKGPAQTEPPDVFEKRFLSRCLRIPFDTSTLNGDLTGFLAKIWRAETKEPLPNLEEICRNAGGSVRDALQSLELELMVRVVTLPPAPAPEPAPAREVRKPSPAPRKSTPVPAPVSAPETRKHFGSMFAWSDGYGKAVQ